MLRVRSRERFGWLAFAMAVATTIAKASQPNRSLLRTLSIVVHILAWFFRPRRCSGSSRLTRHQGGEEITSIDRRGKLTVSDNIVGELGRRDDGAARNDFRDDVPVWSIHHPQAVGALSDTRGTGRRLGNHLAVHRRGFESHPQDGRCGNARSHCNSANRRPQSRGEGP